MRKWFAHKGERWEAFQKKYYKELEDKKVLVEQLKTMDNKGVVTLLYAAKDKIRNNAVVLKDLLNM